MATALAPGDIAVIGVNSDNPDAFNFVLLTDITAGTEIFFTDNGVLDNGTFRANEGVLKYTAAADLAAGTVIEFAGANADFTAETGAFALSASGDQVIAYQGTSANPNFIYAVQTNSTQFQTTATSSNDSALPTGLAVGSTAVAVGSGDGAEDEFDNSTYNEFVTSGTQAELLAAISDAANWNGSNAPITDLAKGPFTVDGGNNPSTNIVINEVDADTPGSDAAEFVELFDGGVGNTSLDGLTVVFFNGNGDESYAAFDLDGFSTNADGFFVLGNASVANVNLVFGNGTLQNGADAVAIYQGDATDFDGTSPTTTDLVDAIVYDTNDSDDTGLLAGLGQSTQFNEGANGNQATESNSRVPDSTGDFVAQAPTPGTINDVPPPDEITPIFAIQGASHVSPFVLADGQTVIEFFDTLPTNTFNVTGDDVTTTGIVTAVDNNGFYLQDPTGDGDAATSDALFVFTGSGSNPAVNPGDELRVSGTVSEFFPGRTSTGNLPLTQITDSTFTELSTGNALPAATIIGAGGLIPPNASIDDDAFATYEPATDGIDFFEALEATLVTATDLVSVAGTNRFGEIYAVADQGASATGLSDRGTLNISPDDFNPEKIQIDADATVSGFDIPNVSAGDALGDVTGVISYSFGNFEILPTAPFTPVAGGLQAETTSLTGSEDQLTVASYNVLNLDPNDGDGDTDVADGRFDAIAQQIVNNLATPDIIGLQEVQDNNGSVNDGVTAADATLQLLVDSIAAAGGPQYAFIDNTFITDGASGGQPGGNIRTAILYNPDRVDLIDGSVRAIGGQAPGEAFNGARLPLAADFEFQGQEITFVDNHFSSKGGSAPILGIEQDFADLQEDPTVNGSLDERQVQSAAVQDFVNDVFNADADANVVVLGDFNEFEFVSPVLDIETNTPLTNLTNTLPEDERYSFIFQGNSQAIDHVFVSESLAADSELDAVHVNVEFAATDSRASDHDPLVARITFDIEPPEPAVLTVEAEAIADVDVFQIQDSDVASGGQLLSLAGQNEGEIGTATFTFEGAAGDYNVILGAFDENDGQATLQVAQNDNILRNILLVEDLNGNLDNARTKVERTVATDLTIANGDTFTITGFEQGHERARFDFIRFEPIAEPDNIIGGTRNDDTRTGTRDNDAITGDRGNDTLNGRQGNDTIEGGRGGDLIIGGAGDDVLAADRVDRFTDFNGTISELRGGNGSDTLFGGRQDDLLGGGNGNDVLLGKNGDDLLRGAGGDDLINGGLGDDTLRGQAGIDTADYSDLTFNGVFGTVAGLDVNLSSNRAQHSSNNLSLTWTDTLTTIENVIGTRRNDRFIGNSDNNNFDGRGEVGRNNRRTTFTDVDGDVYQVTADVVEYQGLQSDFNIVGSAGNFTVTGTGSGTDTLIDIEFVKFDDALVATADLSFV